MLVVISILAITAIVTIPNVIAWRSGMQFRAAVNELRNDLESAKTRAVKENATVTVAFDPTAGQYRMTYLDQVANTILLKSQTLPAGVRIATENPAHTLDSLRQPDQLQFTRNRRSVHDRSGQSTGQDQIDQHLLHRQNRGQGLIMKNLSANVRGPRSRYSIGREQQRLPYARDPDGRCHFFGGVPGGGLFDRFHHPQQHHGQHHHPGHHAGGRAAPEFKGHSQISQPWRPAPTPIPNPIDDQGNPGGIYTRSWTISDPLQPTPHARRIQVRVSWNRLGQNRAVVLTTITRGNGT